MSVPAEVQQLIREIAAKPVFLDGAFVPGEADSFTVVHPADGSTIAEVASASDEQVHLAVQAAHAALDSWQLCAPSARAQILTALADAVERERATFAQVVTAELGSPITLSTRLHASLPVDDIRAVVEALDGFPFERRIRNSTVELRASGVVAAITPWNYPVHQVVAKIIPALAAGCTVVLKPSELSTTSALLLARCAAKAGLPSGVLNIVPGAGRRVGQRLLAEDVDVVSFTGSTQVGGVIATELASRFVRVHLELGGKSASLVAPTADLTTATKVTLANCFLNAGQSCNAWTRLLVQNDRIAEIDEIVNGLIGRYMPGDPFDETTRFGPVVSAARQSRIWEDIESGAATTARVVAGGAGLPDGFSDGAYVSPTVLIESDPRSRLAQEEIFGPVLTVLGYDTLDDAIAIANDTMYGLGGGVWAADQDEAAVIARRIRTGQVDLNGGSFNPAAPFGGFGASGHGRELGVFGIESFLETQSLQY